jgi:hypothetical protein
MRNPGIQQILLLLFFIALPLINFLLQRVRKRRDHRNHPIPQEKSVEQVLRRTPATPPPPPTPRASRSRLHGSEVRTIAPPSNNRFPKRLLLGTRRDVRRGVVIMTLLGPCRAFDPPG